MRHPRAGFVPYSNRISRTCALQEKGDKAPDQWKPPLVSYWCTYATDWVMVKHAYALTITVPERAALSSMLDRC